MGIAFPQLAVTSREHDIISAIASHAPVITLPYPNRRRHRLPTQPSSQSQTRPQSRSNSRNGVESQHLARPSANRYTTQRPYGYERGRTALRRPHQPTSITHGSPPFAPYSSASPPFAPSLSASPPFAPSHPMPISATASPPFASSQDYVLHLNGMSELSHVLFHNPRALAGLRDAAAARFVAWREREHNPALGQGQDCPAGEEPRKKPFIGLFGFEDPDAGSEEELSLLSDQEPDEIETVDDEDMIMRTLWKLSHTQEESGEGTVRPPSTREPLPHFQTPESVAGTSPPSAPAKQVRRKAKQFGASTIRPERRGTALERSVYHDPLHVPSLVALAVSVLPQLLGRALRFRSGAPSPREPSEKAYLERGEDDGEGRGWSGLTVLLSVGAACAATFCAGWVCGFWMS